MHWFVQGTGHAGNIFGALKVISNILKSILKHTGSRWREAKISEI